MSIKTVELPPAAGWLDRFSFPAAATSGDGVEISQTPAGTRIALCDGRHSALIETPAPGETAPFLVDPADLAKADPAKPVALYLTGETTALIQDQAGNLVEIAIRPGQLQPSAVSVADAVDAEVASGMTRQVFEVDPRHLVAAAEAIIACGGERCEIAVAPRWNVLKLQAVSETLAASIMIAGETFDAPAPTPDQAGEDETEDADPLSFKVEDRRGSHKGTASKPPTRRRGKTWKDKVEANQFDPGDLPF